MGKIRKIVLEETLKSNAYFEHTSILYNFLKLHVLECHVESFKENKQVIMI